MVISKIMVDINNTIAILALRGVKGIGSAAIKKLLQQGLFSGESYYDIFEKGILNLKKIISDHEVEELIQEAKFQLENCNSYGISIVDIASEKFPNQLIGLNSPPSVLYYKGNLDRTRNTIGIIGTREPNEKCKEIAKRIGTHFTEKGYSICNGLAVGIDEASIENNNGIHSGVVGVVAGGLNFNETRTLLKSTAIMAERVLESGGLIVSEFPMGIKEDTYKVVDSCAIQAGLSNGLILIQSKIDGGSKYTLKTYAELERPFGVLSIPEIANDSSLEANKLILSNSIEGISRITDLKPEKVKLGICIPISKKSDYDIFEEAVRKNTESENQYGTLF